MIAVVDCRVRQAAEEAGDRKENLSSREGALLSLALVRMSGGIQGVEGSEGMECLGVSERLCMQSLWIRLMESCSTYVFLDFANISPLSRWYLPR